MSQVIRFDCFEIDLDAGILRKRGNKIGLRDQPLQVLALLLEHPGQVVTRDDLRRRLWGDEVFVDFDNSRSLQRRVDPSAQDLSVPGSLPLRPALSYADAQVELGAMIGRLPDYSK